MSFMWAVGLNITSTLLVSTPVEDGGYGFDARSMGFLYFAPLSAVGLGEAFGHFFNDWIAARYVRKHGGVLKPEARLLTTYVAAVFLAVGLVVVGQTLEKRLSVVGLAFGWWMNTFGIMLSSVSVTAYVSDSYGVAGSEVSGLLNFARGMILLLFVFPFSCGRMLIFGSHLGVFGGVLPAALGAEERVWNVVWHPGGYSRSWIGNYCDIASVRGENESKGRASRMIRGQPLTQHSTPLHTVSSLPPFFVHCHRLIHQGERRRKHISTFERYLVTCCVNLLLCCMMIMVFRFFFSPRVNGCISGSTDFARAKKKKI